MASTLLPARFWGLDGLIDSFPKFYIQDLLEMPAIESHTGIFRYQDHPVSTVDILGVIIKVVQRDKIIIYAVDDGTGVICCSCFKSTSVLQEGTINKLKDEFKGGPMSERLDAVLAGIEQCSIGFNIGQLLHVRGVLQTYNNIREIRAYHCAVVHCPSAETERMLHLPHLYRTVYDQPFVLPDRLAREVSSLPKGELDQKKLTHKLQLQEEFTKLILSDLDEKESQMTSEHELFETVKGSTEAVVHLQLQEEFTKLILSDLDEKESQMTSPLITMIFKLVKNYVIRYNQQLHNSVVKIISKHTEHQRDSSDNPGCHFLHIYVELRKLLPFAHLNKSSLWKCLALLEEQSDIISSTEKHFIVFS